MKKSKFYGHGSSNIIANILLAVLGPISIYLFGWMIRLEIPALGLYATAWFILMLLPNATYLFLEVKHIVFVQDGIAFGRPIGAIIGFGGMSLLGLVLQIVDILLLVHVVPQLGAYPILSIVVLSILCALGGVFGILDVASSYGMIFPPIMIYLLYKVVTNGRLILLTCGVALLLSGLTISVYLLM